MIVEFEIWNSRFEIRDLVLGSWFLVLGSWFLGFETRDLQFQNTPSLNDAKGH